MPKNKLPQAGSKESHQNVLLEEMGSKFEMLGEKIQSFETRINEKIDDWRAELKQDIKMTQQALGMRIDKNTAEITTLSKRVDDNTSAIVEFSGKVDKISDRLDHHEEEITHLKEAAV